MRHATMFFAAATVFFGVPIALQAEPLPAGNNTEVAARDIAPAPVATPASDTAHAPAAVPPAPPVAGITADAGIKDAPQEAKPDPIQHAAPPVRPPHRMVTHHAGPGCKSPHHHLAQVMRPARPAHIAAPRATMWLAASSESRCSPGLCSKFVLLGVGY
ncbi:hypothetical protein QEV83_09820 [Methylocapsa sp. D3K7]|uniref:hypothetical protein n=1 Tax=Methylocapsa sp. D3K7 TaxID=3041435 RepID=UPI00244EF4F6|nr:hypothetical protein [Methylocapsa sp. D3K7]WGJ13030.1 hypothetical protein QEV83_09820 [Methylocapsa sp. D3K7]